MSAPTDPVTGRATIGGRARRDQSAGEHLEMARRRLNAAAAFGAAALLESGNGVTDSEVIGALVSTIDKVIADIDNFAKVTA